MRARARCKSGLGEAAELKKSLERVSVLRLRDAKLPERLLLLFMADELRICKGMEPVVMVSALKRVSSFAINVEPRASGHEKPVSPAVLVELTL